MRRRKLNKKNLGLTALVIAALIFCSVMVFSPAREKRVKEAYAPNGVITQSRAAIELAAAYLSERDGRVYEIDDRYYDDEVIGKYIDTVAKKEPSEMNGREAAQMAEEIFSFEDRGKKIILRQRKPEDIVLGSAAAKADLNAFDYACFGSENKEIMKISKGFYLSQNAEGNENIPYSGGSLRTSGCGPTALAMAINYALGEKMTDAVTAAQWAKDHNFVQENVGTVWELFKSYPKEFGLRVFEKAPSDTDELKDMLKKSPVLITSMRKGDFTDGGHIIAITGVKDGLLQVLDPASICRSLEKWDAELILSQSNGTFWGIGEK